MTATVHGFRSTFRTWGQNETSHEREVLEYCLHHIEGEEAKLAYARGDVWGSARLHSRHAKRSATANPHQGLSSSLERQEAEITDVAILHGPEQAAQP